MVNKGRAALAAGVIVAAFALVLGFSGAPAAATSSSSKARIVVVSTSPAEPTAGQTYTMRVELMKDGVVLPNKNVGCYATSGGRFVKLLDQGTDGTVAHCSWAVPKGSTGKTLDGIVAVLRDTGTWYYLGFDLSIR